MEGSHHLAVILQDVAPSDIAAGAGAGVDGLGGLQALQQEAVAQEEAVPELEPMLQSTKLKILWNKRSMQGC